MNAPVTIFRVIFMVTLATLGVSTAVGQQPEKPRVFLLAVSAREPSDTAFKKIDREAKNALVVKIDSIVTKQATPPSGDKHDYMSQAPYFWRNPNTATGFPYIRKDGERNPEIKQFPDHDLLDTMIKTVERLALGYHVTGKKEYAARAGEILRMWFIDPATKMNPNLQFAQAIPGLNTGRGFGIIETRGLTRVVDSVGLLAGSPSWSPSDQAGVETWFSKYLTWLLTSKNGKDESAAKNNHGTHYDVQVASFALFVGNRDVARSTLETAKQKRIAAQIEKDGRQPLELERTKSWDYSVMNLEGFISLAKLGEHAGVDLWGFQTADGRGIRKAALFLDPFARDPKKWPYKQISPINPARFHAIVEKVRGKYKDPEFQRHAAPNSPN